jgi:hypothetical protein
MNMMMFCSSLGLFIVGLSSNNVNSRKMWISGLIMFFVYPVLTEIIIAIKAKLFKNTTSNKSHKCLNCQNEMELRDSLPIIYSERYNISFAGLEKVHPFDS